MPDFHVFRPENDALNGLGRVQAETAALAIELVVATQQLKRKVALVAIAATDIHWRSEAPVWPTPGCEPYEALPLAGTEGLLELRRVAPHSTLESLVAVANSALVWRFIPTLTQPQMAEQYRTLLTSAGVQVRELSDALFSSPEHQHWQAFLESQAELDGLKLEFCGVVAKLHRGAGAARPPGRNALPVRGRRQPARAGWAAERDYGPLLRAARTRVGAPEPSPAPARSRLARLLSR